MFPAHTALLQYRWEYPKEKHLSSHFANSAAIWSDPSVFFLCEAEFAKHAEMMWTSPDE